MNVELCFPIVGHEVPLDHGYLLYCAISRVLPWVHEADWLQILTLPGLQVSQRAVSLEGGSRLRMRAPTDRLTQLLPLAGKRIKIFEGAHTSMLTCGAPQIKALRPSP